jgi:ankyrin repeat protein
MYDYSTIVTLLIQANASVNIQDMNGKTAFFYGNSILIQLQFN